MDYLDDYDDYREPDRALGYSDTDEEYTEEEEEEEEDDVEGCDDTYTDPSVPVDGKGSTIGEDEFVLVDDDFLEEEELLSSPSDNGLPIVNTFSHINMSDMLTSYFSPSKSPTQAWGFGGATVASPPKLSLNGESIPFDALVKVFSYLDDKDVYTSSQVSENWREASWRERYLLKQKNVTGVENRCDAAMVETCGDEDRNYRRLFAQKKFLHKWQKVDSGLVAHKAVWGKHSAGYSVSRGSVAIVKGNDTEYVIDVAQSYIKIIDLSRFTNTLSTYTNGEGILLNLGGPDKVECYAVCDEGGYVVVSAEDGGVTVFDCLETYSRYIECGKHLNSTGWSISLVEPTSNASRISCIDCTDRAVALGFKSGSVAMYILERGPSPSKAETSPDRSCIISATLLFHIPSCKVTSCAVTALKVCGNRVTVGYENGNVRVLDASSEGKVLAAMKVADMLCPRVDSIDLVQTNLTATEKKKLGEKPSTMIIAHTSKGPNYFTSKKGKLLQPRPLKNDYKYHVEVVSYATSHNFIAYAYGNGVMALWRTDSMKLACQFRYTSHPFKSGIMESVRVFLDPAKITVVFMNGAIVQWWLDDLLNEGDSGKGTSTVKSVISKRMRHFKMFPPGVLRVWSDGARLVMSGVMMNDIYNYIEYDEVAKGSVCHETCAESIINALTTHLKPSSTSKKEVTNKQPEMREPEKPEFRRIGYGSGEPSEEKRKQVEQRQAKKEAQKQARRNADKKRGKEKKSGRSDKGF